MDCQIHTMLDFVLWQSARQDRQPALGLNMGDFSIIQRFRGKWAKDSSKVIFTMPVWHI
jgi:hypothetical protein